VSGADGVCGERLVHDGISARCGELARWVAARADRSATRSGFLDHLRSQGIDFVPEPFGYDEQGREVLDFVQGDVGSRHLAPCGNRSPDRVVWRSPHCSSGPSWSVTRTTAPATWCFRSGLPVALIDFDLARPPSRSQTAATPCMYLWVPLVDPAGRRPAARGLGAAAGIGSSPMPTGCPPSSGD